MAHAAARAALTVAELSRSGPGPGHALADVASTRELAAQLGGALYATGIDRVTIVLDTFEDAPYPSADRVHRLAELLAVLHDQLPGLHAIIVSRSPLALPGAATLELGALDPESAEVYVREHGVRGDAVATALAIGRGDPLCLWLAAAVAAGGGALDPALAGAPLADAQRALCSELVAQVQPPALQRLISPGLVVRRITPEIVREVLAGPCQLAAAGGALDAGRIAELVSLLGRQVGLVRCSVDGALELRGEIRRLMLPELAREQPDVVREIHERAAAYHEARDDEASLAEAAYHRFALGELHGPWLDRLTPRAGARLRGALDELPEPAWPVLASYAGIDMPPERLAGASVADLERRLARRLEELLREDRVEDALALISRSRPPASRSSELWRWEARVLHLAGRPRSALAAFERSLAGRDASSAAARADRALAIALAEQLHDRRALARLGGNGAAASSPHGAPWLDDHALRALVGDAITATGRSVAAAQSAAAIRIPPAEPTAPSAPAPRDEPAATPTIPAMAAAVYATAARLNRTPRAADGSVPLQDWVDTLPGVHLHPPIDSSDPGPAPDPGLADDDEGLS